MHFKDGQADIRRCLILLSLHPDRGDIWRRLATLVSAIVDIETPRNPNSIMADRQMVFDYISQVLNVEVAEARAPKDPDATLEEWKHEFEPWKKVLSLLLAEEAARQKKAAALLAVQGPAPTRTVSLKSSVSTAMLPGGV